MAEPAEFFKVLTEIPHVKGAFVYDLDGELIYSDLEDITKLQQDILGRRLRALREMLQGKIETLNGFFFKFGDCKIFLRMTPDCFIGIFADNDADQRTIQIASNVLVKVFDVEALRDSLDETRARSGKIKLSDSRAVRTMKISSANTPIRIQQRPAPVEAAVEPAVAPVEEVVATETVEAPVAESTDVEGAAVTGEPESTEHREEDMRSILKQKAMKLFRKKKEDE